jgi:hypothetical protein
MQGGNCQGRIGQHKTVSLTDIQILLHLATGVSSLEINRFRSISGQDFLRGFPQAFPIGMHVPSKEDGSLGKIGCHQGGSRKNPGRPFLKRSRIEKRISRPEAQDRIDHHRYTARKIVQKRPKRHEKSLGQEADLDESRRFDRQESIEHLPENVLLYRNHPPDFPNVLDGQARRYSLRHNSQCGQNAEILMESGPSRRVHASKNPDRTGGPSGHVYRPERGREIQLRSDRSMGLTWFPARTAP